MNQVKDLLLGIDFGTGGCKFTLIDAAGTVHASGSGEYPIISPNPGWAEQNPADWFRVMSGLTRGIEYRNRIAAVGLTGYTHGAVLLDEAMRVIRPAIIWTDQRSTKECEFLKRNYFDFIFKTAYQAPTPTWTLPQMLWLKNNEPENMAKVKHILFVKDYIRFLLTGEMACDSIEAQGTLFWDVRNSCWSEELCALAGLPLNALPEIAGPTDIAGKINAVAAAKTGLPEGIPVIMGATDSAAEAYASGAVLPGQCILKIATAGNVNVMTREAQPHPETLTYSHVVPGLWYSVAATNSAAVCQRWFRDNMGSAEMDYERLNELASQSPPGSNGVFFHPYLMGERSPYWDPCLRASFTGISIGTLFSDLSRALLEGVAFSLLDCYRTIKRIGLSPHEFILTGGGAKSRIWGQIVCDVFNVPLKCPSVSDASFGGALLAGVGANVFSDEISAVRKCLKIAVEIFPDRENAELYADKFKYYRKICDALTGVYGELNTTNQGEVK